MTCGCRRPIKGAKIWEMCNGCNKAVQIGKPCPRCKTEPEPNSLQPVVEQLQAEVERLKRREQQLLGYNNQELERRREAECKLEERPGFLDKLFPKLPDLQSVDYGEMEARVLAIEEQHREQERNIIVKWLRGLAGAIRRGNDPDLKGREYWYDGVADDIQNGNGTLDLLRKEQRGY